MKQLMDLILQPNTIVSSQIYQETKWCVLFTYRNTNAMDFV
jgi:hypothetical protein